MRRTYAARVLLPIHRPPIDGGWITVADGRIEAVGAGLPPGAAEDLGDVALLPGLVNAHTHLELSWLAGRIPPAGSMIEWIRTLLRLRAAGPAGGEAEIVEAIGRAAVELYTTGTVLVGDVANTTASIGVLRTLGMPAVVFHELLGFNVLPSQAQVRVREAWERVGHAIAGSAVADHAGGVVESVVSAHAPYSTSASLFREIAGRGAGQPLAVHLAESADEVEFLHSGTGVFRTLLADLGVWDPAWQPPAAGPVEFLHRVGYLRPGLLAVHAVHLTDDELVRLGEAGAFVVTCPRSNEWVGGGIPRIAHFYAARVPVAIGTDSLASTGSLNMFDELAAVRRLAPDVTAATILDSGTRVGALALGRGREYGTLEAGKRAALVAVSLPAGVGDVEEYLVSGVPAAAVRPLT
jgi:cytosine/adenosine deaminase-related metal-dependent hydrolase